MRFVAAVLACQACALDCGRFQSKHRYAQESHMGAFDEAHVQAPATISKCMEAVRQADLRSPLRSLALVFLPISQDLGYMPSGHRVGNRQLVTSSDGAIRAMNLATTRRLRMQEIAVEELEDAIEDGPDFLQRREELKSCLTREYRSFFRPFEEEFYSEDVSFLDPLNNITGRNGYKGNVAMLSGESWFGNLLFENGFIDLHAVEDVPGDLTRLRSRWTLGFDFKLLPWKPSAIFTGISDYKIDESSALVLSQRDYWDVLSLGKGGSYEPEGAFRGAIDLVLQWLPESLKDKVPAAQEPSVADLEGWTLLRRAEAYRIYRVKSKDIGGDVVVAVEAPSYKGGLDGVAQELEKHGMVNTLRRDWIRKGIGVIEVLPPHPWDTPLP